MRWSVVLVCILLLAVVAEGKKKKPSKGKKPGKKPSKPGVKGECDVGSPKLTPQNTKKYTGTGKCACWWDITRTRSLDQTRRREAAVKQGRTRSTARPSKEIASTSATVIPTPLARRRPTWASLDSTGSVSATRDTLETESNAWTAMATSVPNLANKLR